jgi:hypothetical protein
LCCACSKNEAGSGPLLPNLENGIRGITMPVITEAIVKEIGAEKIFTIDEALADIMSWEECGFPHLQNYKL